MLMRPNRPLDKILNSEICGIFGIKQNLLLDILK